MDMGRMGEGAGRRSGWWEGGQAGEGKGERGGSQQGEFQFELASSNWRVLQTCKRDLLLVPVKCRRTCLTRPRRLRTLLLTVYNLLHPCLCLPTTGEPV